MSHGALPAPARIVLVGFMAAGKSTVGRLLAERIGWEFVDLDHRVLERTGSTAGELIRREGEPAFRKMEAALTAELAGAERLVLAPGGGWAIRPELADRLGPGTVRVWLRVSLDEALRRAESAAESQEAPGASGASEGAGGDRPLLGPRAGRRERMAALLSEREPLYGRAELVVDVDGKEPVVVVEEILARIGVHQEGNER